LFIRVGCEKLRVQAGARRVVVDADCGAMPCVTGVTASGEDGRRPLG
jgi:hypothetical protein